MQFLSNRLGLLVQGVKVTGALSKGANHYLCKSSDHFIQLALKLWGLNALRFQLQEKKVNFVRGKKKKQQRKNSGNRLHFASMPFSGEWDRKGESYMAVNFSSVALHMGHLMAKLNNPILCTTIQCCLFHIQHELLWKCDVLVYSHCCRNGEDASHLVF